jgi:hypothetical protein
MALGMYFTPTGFTKDKYDTAIRKLEEAGAGSPPGRTYHVALETPDGIAVYDTWESQEQFDAFGATLMPILADVGIEPPMPMVMPVHNVILG